MDLPAWPLQLLVPRHPDWRDLPAPVVAEDGPQAPPVVYELNVPVLGICYGLHTMAQQLGGRVEPSSFKEFGFARVTVGDQPSRLLQNIEDRVDAAGGPQLDVWMSHGDKVIELPPGFELVAKTDSAPVAVMADDGRGYYGVQFHPEVTHTAQGERILKRFVHEICGCEENWTAANIIRDSIARVREQVGDDHVILGLSGGVDSSAVVAMMAQLQEELPVDILVHAPPGLAEAFDEWGRPLPAAWESRPIDVPDPDRAILLCGTPAAQARRPRDGRARYFNFLSVPGSSNRLIRASRPRNGVTWSSSIEVPRT